MSKDIIVTEKDVGVAVTFITSLLFNLSYYLTLFSVFWFAFDVDSFANNSTTIQFVTIIALFLFFLILGFCDDALSRVIYKCFISRLVFTHSIVLFIIRIAHFFELKKGLLKKHFIFVPFIFVSLLIAQHGIALGKDWLVYVDPVVVPEATSHSLLPSTNPGGRERYCFFPVKGGGLREYAILSDRVCDVRAISYQGVTYVRKMYYFIDDQQSSADNIAANRIYASRLMPSNMTSGFVISDYSLQWRKIKLFFIAVFITLLCYFFVCPNWIKTKYEKWMEKKKLNGDK